MEMYEKLELIAKCLREGREVEFLDANGKWGPSEVSDDSRVRINIWGEFEYRAKPEKPRISNDWWDGLCNRHTDIQAVELTDSVRSALEDAGIDLT